jgi:preprotein translocase subunit YajC
MIPQAILQGTLNMKPAVSAAALVLWQAAGGGSLVMFGTMAAIFAVFYILLILPQQRKQKKWQEMLEALKTGDRVVTSGGIRGVIMTIKDDYLYLRVAPDNLKIEVARSAIISVSGDDAKS